MTVEALNTEEIITKLSTFGKYQKINFLLISLAIVYSSVQYSYVFSTRSTKHRCYIEECDNDLQVYNQTWLKHAIPMDVSGPRKCERYASIFDSETNQNKSQGDFCSSKLFNTSDIQKCDKLVIEGNDFATTIEQEFNLTCEENLWKLTALGSLDEIAEVVFSPFVGYFSDRFGRKWVLISSLVLSGVSGVIKSFSPTYFVFAIMEFVTACFTSGIYGSGFILGVELLLAEKRVFGSTIIAIVFPFGEILLGVAAWFSPSWGFMLRVLYAPGILFICYCWLMDDSFRFLVASGKNKKARRVFKRIVRINNLNLPEDMQLTDMSTKPTSTNASSSDAATDSSSSDNNISKLNDDDEDEIQRESFMEMFKHPSLILRVLNCSFSWISCTFMYYGLTIYSVSLTGNIYLNFIIMAVIELPGYIICYYTLDSLGRRFMLVASLVLSGVACLASSLIPPELWIVQLILPIIGKFAATMAFKTIYIYTAEMFPTTLRHTLLAFCSMFGRAGSIAAPQLPILATISPVLPAILFGILGVSAGILALALPETTGCNLPDTIKDSLHIGKKNNIESTKIDKSI